MLQTAALETGNAALLHADLRRLHEYWDMKRAGRAMPCRADIDPLDFGWILGRVSLVEVASTEPRFRFRLLASRLAEHLGYEVTGRSTSDIPEPDLRAYVEAQYARVADSAAAHTDCGELLLDGRLWRSEAVYLPLSQDGIRVDMILVARITEKPKRHIVSLARMASGMLRDADCSGPDLGTGPRLATA